MMNENTLPGQNQRELHDQKSIGIDPDIRLRAFFESGSNFHVLLGKSCEVIDFNKTAFNFIKSIHKVELNRGDHFVKYVHPTFTASFIERYNQGLEGKKSLEEGSSNC
jgi:hypothetical protein